MDPPRERWSINLKVEELTRERIQAVMIFRESKSRTGLPEVRFLSLTTLKVSLWGEPKVRGKLLVCRRSVRSDVWRDGKKRTDAEDRYSARSRDRWSSSALQCRRDISSLGRVNRPGHLGRKDAAIQRDSAGSPVFDL